MIDTAMLTRLMVLTGFAPPEIPMPKATKEMLALAKVIWAEAQKDEREECAKVCDTHTVDDVLVGVGIAKSCADMIRGRSNANVCGLPHGKDSK